jgi:hypothetical protein
MLVLLESIGPYVGYGGLVVLCLFAFTVKQHSNEIRELKRDNISQRDMLSEIKAGVEYIKGRLENDG